MKSSNASRELRIRESSRTRATDLRVAKRVYFGERISLDMIVDMFNLVNRLNVSSVNVLWTNAGQPTSAYDPRQFQFALKVNW